MFLFTPYYLGELHLKNRIVMAPMTRCRTPAPAFAPGAMTEEYYAQRASAGLIVSEGIVVSAQARGYSDTPGLYNPVHEAAWRPVTQAVHEGGGRIFAQLWHCGRISHASLQPGHAAPLGPGAIRANCETFAPDLITGEAILEQCSPPRAMITQEAKDVVADFVHAAHRAVAAGFDGVEIHAANGYLFDQFRCPYLNERTDEYGGNLKNRCRLLMETSIAVAEAIGHDRTGVRLSPLGLANDMRCDPEPMITYGYLARELNGLGVVYLHLNNQDGSWSRDAHNPLLEQLRQSFSRTLILCGEYDRARAEQALLQKTADLIAFGRPYISNPDLVDRMNHDQKLAPGNPATYYSSGATGYLDYPTFESGSGRTNPTHNPAEADAPIV